MITVSKMAPLGRLGNQIHQLALLVGVSAKRGYEYGIPWQSLEERDSSILEVFDLHCHDTTGMKFEHHWWERGDSTAFKPAVFSAHNSTDFEGWFQSHHYFEHCEDELQEVLQFQPQLRADAQVFLDDSRAGKNVTGIHVRRTDFAGRVRMCPVEYYEKAMAMFPGTTFIVFSDDIEWCRDNLKAHVFSDNDYRVDFCSLCLCDNLIMANSTFSWWAGWFCSRRGKDVVAPADWGFYRKWDLFYPGWVKIEYGQH